MENEQSEWNRAESPPVADVAKNPETTATAELVKDYEDLLAEIKSRKASHDGEMALLDATRDEAIKNYEIAMKGASTEAAKLLVLISKRLGVPLNGAQPVTAAPAERRPHRAVSDAAKAARVAGGRKKVQCDICGDWIAKMAMGVHKAAHRRRGETAGRVIPKSPVYTGKTAKRFSQSMGAEKIASMIKDLRRLEPITVKNFSIQRQHNESPFMSGLKERGLVINDPATGLWTLTEKGRNFAG